MLSITVFVLNCGCRTGWNWAWPVSSEIARGSKWPWRLCMAVFQPDVLVKLPFWSLLSMPFVSLCLPGHPSSWAAYCTKCFLSGCRSAANKIRRFPLICGWGTFLTQPKLLFDHCFPEYHVVVLASCFWVIRFAGSRFRRALSGVIGVSLVFEVLNFAVEVFLSASHT